MLNDALTAITHWFADQLAVLVSDVDSHPGRFTEAELERMLLSNKAVRIAIETAPGLTINGQGIHQARLLMAAYIICGDSGGVDRHKSALEIVEHIIGLLPYNRFDTTYLRSIDPKTITAENLYSGEIDNRGIAMWGVSWEQTVTNQGN